MSDKTEEPTPRRLRKAREQGDLPVSAAACQSAAFAAAWVLAPAAVAATIHTTAVLLDRGLAGDVPTSGELAFAVVALCAPLLLAAALAAGALGLMQTGAMVAPQKLVPDFSRANPFTGLRQLFRAERWFALVRSLLAAVLTGGLGVVLLRDQMPAVAHTPGQTSSALALAGVLSHRLAGLALAVAFALAGLDLLVTRWSWRKRHRMTKDEVRREHRESEGDPEIKAARRRAHQEALEGAALLAVKDATVVIVNPTHFATALAYREEHEEAPRVVSQGRGELARKIIDAARAYGVPVVRDVPVARALAELEVGDEIPEVLYEAVAEILREIWERESQ
jgi:flagellar biosynthesis protein FlhB